jgi:hypothetical protein
MCPPKAENWAASEEGKPMFAPWEEKNDGWELAQRAQAQAAPHSAMRHETLQEMSWAEIGGVWRALPDWRFCGLPIGSTHQRQRPASMARTELHLYSFLASGVTRPTKTGY